jgi:hypothetical protein
MSEQCKHCRNGWLDNRFGQDVECVNGVLIDIDEFNENWSGDTVHPVAPCHPMWERQLEDEDAETWENDSIDRLNAAAGHGDKA